MRKLLFFNLMTLLVLVIVSCSSSETYADKKNKESNAISQLISDSGFVVITEDQFYSQDSMTGKDEFVLFESSGVYMNIQSIGCGSKIKKNSSASVIWRWNAYDIENEGWTEYMTLFGDLYEKVYVSNTNGTLSALYIDGTYNSSDCYNSSTGAYIVPTGFLVPLLYVNVGRPQSDSEDIARVRLIVPHSAGTYYASSYVLPYYVEITYELDR